MSYPTTLRASILLSACFMFAACSDNNDVNNSPQTNNTTPDMSGCIAGQTGCACTAESSCVSGAMCVEGMCVGAATSGLSITTATARSCEVLFVEAGGERVLGVEFAPGVIGAWRRQAPHVAITFAREGDLAFDAGLAALQFEGSLAQLKLKQLSCFDSSGKRIDEAKAELQ